MPPLFEVGLEIAGIWGKYRWRRHFKKRNENLSGQNRLGLWLPPCGRAGHAIAGEGGL
jgi:hypothetical protein